MRSRYHESGRTIELASSPPAPLLARGPASEIGQIFLNDFAALRQRSGLSEIEQELLAAGVAARCAKAPALEANCHSAKSAKSQVS